jgi:hypothetical protein
MPLQAYVRVQSSPSARNTARNASTTIPSPQTHTATTTASGNKQFLIRTPPFQQAPTLGGECYANLEDREITIIPPRPTASSPQPPPHAAKPHPHNNDAASNHPSHNATPSPSSSNEDYNTVNNAHATHTPTNAPNTHESPANDETTHYPNTPPSAHPDALPPALTHPNTAPQPPSDTNPTPPQTLSDAPRPLASPNDLSHSHDPHAHPRGHTAHRAHRRPTLRQRQPYPKAACVQKHHPTRPRNYPLFTCSHSAQNASTADTSGTPAGT